MTPENNNVPGEAHVSTFLKEIGEYHSFISGFGTREKKKKGG